VFPQQSSEEWLMKNFGAFRVSARLEELSTLNMLFSGVSSLQGSLEGSLEVPLKFLLRFPLRFP